MRRNLQVFRNFYDSRVNQYINVVQRVFISLFYNNQINARAMIGQSAVGYCAGKPTAKSHVLWIII